MRHPHYRDPGLLVSIITNDKLEELFFPYCDLLCRACVAKDPVLAANSSGYGCQAYTYGAPHNEQMDYVRAYCSWETGIRDDTVFASKEEFSARLDEIYYKRHPARHPDFQKKLAEEWAKNPTVQHYYEPPQRYYAPEPHQPVPDYSSYVSQRDEYCNARFDQDGGHGSMRDYEREYDEGRRLRYRY